MKRKETLIYKETFIYDDLGHLQIDSKISAHSMVLILDGTSEHVAHLWSKKQIFWGQKFPIWDGCRSYQMP